ncbi:response regulator transcription factor [Vagococcus elongatus]|uniref:DNA-binding response regulator n=1 Tax=Vagococcus elongatus TaxID=180344 RepID=A0A430B4I8_9ENTE|nr:response regulator transcription factor [Vagococcus elongatus]RSU15237.1 DNA-binding response regulator [Vagococcus elongatus]
MSNILIVEDDRAINQLVISGLKIAGFHCFQAYYGMEALRIYEKEDIDLILLDINLPDSDGFSLFRSFKHTPIIYLTARDGLDDRVKGLNLGAEDYIVKPFALPELIARVQVVLRRFNQEESLFVRDELRVDLGKRKVWLADSSVTLTYQEFELLAVLIRHKNLALTREQLIDLAWGFDYAGDERTVDVHIQRLRKKLELHSLKTVYKLGYRLEV